MSTRHPEEFTVTNPDSIYYNSGWTVGFRTTTPDGEEIRHEGVFFYNEKYDLHFTATPRNGLFWQRKEVFRALNPGLYWPYKRAGEHNVAVAYNGETAGLADTMWREFDNRKWDFELRFVPKDV